MKRPAIARRQPVDMNESAAAFVARTHRFTNSVAASQSQVAQVTNVYIGLAHSKEYRAKVLWELEMAHASSKTINFATRNADGIRVQAGEYTRGDGFVTTYIDPSSLAEQRNYVSLVKLNAGERRIPVGSARFFQALSGLSASDRALVIGNPVLYGLVDAGGTVSVRPMLMRDNFVHLISHEEGHGAYLLGAEGGRDYKLMNNAATEYASGQFLGALNLDVVVAGHQPFDVRLLDSEAASVWAGLRNQRPDLFGQSSYSSLQNGVIEQGDWASVTQGNYNLDASQASVIDMTFDLDAASSGFDTFVSKTEFLGLKELDGVKEFMTVSFGEEESPAKFADASVETPGALRFRWGEYLDIAGSALGQALAEGNIAKGIVYSSLLGELGERLGIALSRQSLSAAFDFNINQATGEAVATTAANRGFSTDVWTRMQSAAVGTASSLLAMELGEAIGLKGFGAELFNVAGSTVIGKAFSNVLSTPANPFGGFNPKNIGEGFGKEAFAANGVGTLALSAIGSFLGAKLGSMLVSPQTQAGTVLSSIGSAVGSYAAVQVALQGGLYQLTLWGNLVVPGVGAFVGFVLGALIGNLFGAKKPRTPTAFAETILQLPYARYELGATGSHDNGNVDLVKSMAESARDTLNGLIAAVAGMDRLAYVSNLNGQATDQRYGHTGDQIYVKINGVQSNFASADQAVEYGALTAIRNTKIIGGDIFAKRAIANPNAANLTSLAGDLQIASDYAFYANNRELVNGLIKGAYSLVQTDQDWYGSWDNGENKRKIDKLMVQGYDALTQAEKDWYNVPTTKATADRVIQALEDQSLANPWIITLQRVSELGLDKFTSSDFYGGLRGFLDSFSLAERGLGYENASIKSRTDGSATITMSGASDGVFSILPQALDGPAQGALYNPRFDMNAAGWTKWASPGSWQGVNLNSDWAGSGNDSAFSTMSGVRYGHESVDYWSESAVSQAGVNYQASVYAGQHRGDVHLWMTFHDAAGNQIGGVMATGARELGGYKGDLANYNKVTVTGVAPAGTASRRVVLRLVGRGESDPYAFFTRPETSVVGEAASSTSTWETTGQAVRIDSFAASLGYSMNTGTGGGNDFYDASAQTAGQGIAGLAGDDIIRGGSAADTLSGQEGWDWLDGDAGNDVLYGDAQNDVLLGGAGVDLLYGQGDNDYLSGGDGADSGSGGLFGGVGDDTLVGGAGVDTLLGEDGNDLLIVDPDGGGEWDHMDGGAGSDTVTLERLTSNGEFVDLRAKTGWSWAPANTVYFYGDPWFDIENVTGTKGNDWLWGDTGDNTLKGGLGDDRLEGWDGHDVLQGGAGADYLHGWGGWDFVSYEDSNAGVFVNLSTKEAFGGDAEGDNGFHEIEHLRGSRFADELTGNGWHSQLWGMAGDDWLNHSGNAQWYNGGEGFDTVDFTTASSGVIVHNHNTISVQGGYGGANEARFESIEAFVGSAHADEFYGNGSDETFQGGRSNDQLEGRDGSDTYILGWGDGVDTVVDNNSGANIISLAPDVRVGDIWQGQQGGTGGFLEIGLRGDAASTKAHVNDNFGPYPINNANIIKTIDFGGAGQLDVSKIDAGATGGTGADTLNGLTGKYDMIFGYDGNDALAGSTSAQAESVGNVFIGGTGNDSITSKGGDDQFAFDYGDGIDTITDSGGADTLVFGSTVSAEDVIFEIGTGTDYGLYIGLKDPANPALTAKTVANRVKILNGGKIVEYTDTGVQVHNTLEYVQAGGTWINLKKLDLPWRVAFVNGSGTTTGTTTRTQTSPTNIPPIIFDLGGDGLSLTDVESSTIVSQSATGALFRVGWAGPTDGMLATDRNGDGRIDRISEISFSGDKEGAVTDLEGLAAWDSNGDGQISSLDARYGELLVWVDRNQNGRSTPGELRTLAEAGITSLSLSGERTGIDWTEQTDSFVNERVQFTRADGTTGDAYDVALARRFIHGEGTEDVRDEAVGWDDAKGDGVFGRLVNDPIKEAKAGRTPTVPGANGGSGKSVGGAATPPNADVDPAGVDTTGATQPDKLQGKLTYDEVANRAVVDFTDHDKRNVKDETRWADVLNGRKRDAFVEGAGADKAKHTKATYLDRIDDVSSQELTGERSASMQAEGAGFSYADAAPIMPSLTNVGAGGTGATAAIQVEAAADSISLNSAEAAAELLLRSAPASLWSDTGSYLADRPATFDAAGWWRMGLPDDMGAGAAATAHPLSGMPSLLPTVPGMLDGLTGVLADQQRLVQALAAFHGGSGEGAAAIWTRSGESKPSHDLGGSANLAWASINRQERAIA